jgi:hypothetical protein
MRCVPCGAEMILVSVAPDQTMIVEGFERYTMQCLGCGEVEERFLFRPTAAQAVPASPGAAVAPTMASAWVRAVERLRGQETVVTERRAEQQKADRVTQFYREWEELIPGGRAARSKKPPKPTAPRQIKAAATARTDADSGRPLNTWERAVAKLRARQDRG